MCVCVYTHISHLFQFTCQWFLGCFHILTIGNNAVMNMGYICIFQLVFPFLPDKYPKVALHYCIVYF